MAESVLNSLERSVRRDVEALAQQLEVPPEAVAAEIIGGYIRVLRDAPGALPRNPLNPIAAGAKRRGQR